MIEFTRDKCKKMISWKNVTIRNGYWIRKFYEENMSESFKGVSIQDRMRSCLNYWEWDLYKENRVMDLQRVMKCHNNRWCPVCRASDLSKLIINYLPKHMYFLGSGYKAYLLTLTVPNCKPEDLGKTIEKMNLAFKRFWKWFNTESKKHMYADRKVRFLASLKVLEVTICRAPYSFHPHFHCIVYTDGSEQDIDISKVFKGKYSRKRRSINLHSLLDNQIRNMWYRAFNQIDKSCEAGEDKIYECDIRPLTGNKGVYEVLKYTFKDTDIRNYGDFKYMYFGLMGRRVRQGYGLLYNLKTEELPDDVYKDEQIEDYLLINVEEAPEGLLTDLECLGETYSSYKKISRYKVDSVMSDLS